MSYVTMCEQLFCRQSKHSINVKYAYLHMQQLHRKLHLQPLHVGSPSQQTSPCPKGAGICICSASCGPGAGRSCLEAQRRRSTALGRGYVERSKVPWDISNGDALWTRWPTFAKILCRPMLGGVSRNEKITCLTFEGCMERLHVVLSHKICAYIMHLVSHHRYQCLVLQAATHGPMDWSNLADWLIKLGGVVILSDVPSIPFYAVLSGDYSICLLIVLYYGGGHPIGHVEWKYDPLIPHTYILYILVAWHSS